MKNINLSIQVEINEKAMKENGMSIEDIKKQLIFISDEVIDGYTLTRDNLNNTEDFYIENIKINNKTDKEKMKDYHNVMVALENLITDDDIRQSEIFEDFQNIVNEIDETF